MSRTSYADRLGDVRMRTMPLVFNLVSWPTGRRVAEQSTNQAVQHIGNHLTRQFRFGLMHPMGNHSVNLPPRKKLFTLTKEQS